MINEVFMPALSSTMTEGKIVSWEKSPGDKVEKGETVVVVESDKADMDVESFHEGYLATILVESGEVAPVGSTIALLAETEAEIETAKQQAANQKDQSSGSQSKAPSAPQEKEEKQPSKASTQQTPSRQNGRTIASPRAKKKAKELQVNLSQLQGSGPHGRIVAEDVEAAAGKEKQPQAQPSAPAAPQRQPQPARQFSGATGAPKGDVEQMNTLQNAVVRNMVAALEVPVFHVSYTIPTDNLEALYKKVKSKGVTMTALLAKAVALTLQKHPLLNASYTEGGIQHHSQINISVAVAMGDGGLITPVLQNADSVDIYSLSRTWKDLVERARLKQLQPHEYNSGTFSLSNLGMYGVDSFDAILPPGQGSILAIGGFQPQVFATPEGMMGIRRQVKVNITCDHRIVYGAHAAAFLQDLAQLIEHQPQSLTM